LEDPGFAKTSSFGESEQRLLFVDFVYEWISTAVCDCGASGGCMP